MTSKETDHSISPTKPAISSKRTKKNKDCNRSLAFESFLLRAQSLQTETLKTLPLLTVWRGKRTQKKLNPEYPDLGSFHWTLSNPWLIHGSSMGFGASWLPPMVPMFRGAPLKLRQWYSCRHPFILSCRKGRILLDQSFLEK